MLGDTARAIPETDFTRRIDVRGTDEIADLARTFNAMLDRLESAFGAQRAFTNDASHELRTPITIVRGHLELLGDDPDERRETIELVTDELERMTRFVEDLLLLAKAGRSDFLRREDVDLGALTDELSAKARALAPRTWALDGRGAGPLHVDRQRLTQAIMGLAQNAVQHTQGGDVIALGSANTGPEARVWVRDTGPASRRPSASASSSASRARRTPRGGPTAPASASRSSARSRRRTAARGAVVRARARIDVHRRAADGARRGRTTGMSRILIVEDEARLAAFLEKGLWAAGFATSICSSGTEAAGIATGEDFDLVLLDVGLPGQDGFAVLRELRARGERLSVIMLTARDDIDDTVAGLDGGADDYITEPCVFDELLARVRARLRGAAAGSEERVLEAGDVRLDLASRQASAGGRDVELTAREFRLLEALMRHRGQVLSREQLLSRVWGYGHDPGSNVVDVYVGYLRRRLGAEVIDTVRGMGYRIAR